MQRQLRCLHRAAPLVRGRRRQCAFSSASTVGITPSQKLVSAQVVMLVAPKYLNDTAVLQSVMRIVANILKDKGAFTAGI